MRSEQRRTGPSQVTTFKWRRETATSVSFNGDRLPVSRYVRGKVDLLPGQKLEKANGRSKLMWSPPRVTADQ